MNLPIYFYITLCLISPWLIWYSLMFYYVSKFDTTFEYFITTDKQRYKYWAVIALLPIIFFFIFLLRYRRIGLSLDVLQITDLMLTLIYPLTYLDLGILLVLGFSFVVTWMLWLRCVYQYFRKCLLALYLYYNQYMKIHLFYHRVWLLCGKYSDYLIYRVANFTSNPRIFKITWYIWPFTLDIIEKNLFRYLLPYLIVFDFVIHQGVLSKLFIILPWYYIYSIIRFGLNFFQDIHKPENWDVSEEMYGYPT